MGTLYKGELGCKVLELDLAQQSRGEPADLPGRDVAFNAGQQGARWVLQQLANRGRWRMHSDDDDRRRFREDLVEQV